MSNPDASKEILLLVGPTAVGKTDTGIDVACRMRGEIISADARQVYRYLDIGTGKPTPEQLSQVPHHLISELDPGQPFSAGQFARATEVRIRDILARGRTPLVVGGSTLYVEALVRGFSDIPRVDADVRREINRRLEEVGAGALFRELKTVDPVSARTMDETKSQRIVRALEIYHGTGKRLSEFHASRPTPAFRYSGVVLSRPRDDLYHRINARVDRMLADGLVDEVRALLARGVDPTTNALRTIGYREVVDHLNGHLSHDEMVRLIKRNSRRYAKRQITWFKRYESFRHAGADLPADTIIGMLSAGR